LTKIGVAKRRGAFRARMAVARQSQSESKLGKLAASARCRVVPAKSRSERLFDPVAALVGRKVVFYFLGRFDGVCRKNAGNCLENSVWQPQRSRRNEGADFGFLWNFGFGSWN